MLGGVRGCERIAAERPSSKHPPSGGLLRRFPELATALHQLIHEEPSSEEMRASLELGEKLTSTPPRHAARRS